MQPEQLAERVVAGQRSAIGAALSLVEDRRSSSLPNVLRLLKTIAAQPQPSEPTLRIGVTGPPGVGKSSLLAVVSRELRLQQRRVAILAIDPSSPRSGGALLGDRARVNVDPEDDGLFVRSMASGGDLGGLALCALSAVEVLGASHDVVLIETVGVGQSETDIELVADLTVLVLQPNSGDTLQFLKAGILEIPDIIVLNKCDLAQTREAQGELRATMKAAQAAGLMSDPPHVVLTSASLSQGISELIEAIDVRRSELSGRGEIASRRRAGTVAWCQRLLARRVGEVGIDALGGREAVADMLGRGIDRGMHGLELVVTLVEQFVRECGTKGTKGAL